MDVINVENNNQPLHLVNDYLLNSFVNINGWCLPNLWSVIEPIHEFQVRAKVRNPIAEIGVYHGKFFIGLALTKFDCGNHYAFDVFDLQQFNLDGAGKGNLEEFKKNCFNNHLNNENVIINRVDSMTITDQQINKIHQETGGFSMFSIDGCHLVEHTINDFLIAMKLTCPEGVIFIDDYTNSDWPGVSEGIAKLYLTSQPRFVPLVVTSNKLIVCHISYHKILLSFIRDFFKNKRSDIRLKDVKKFGYDCLNVYPDHNNKKYMVNI